MTRETDLLKQEIESLRSVQQPQKERIRRVFGYHVTVNILTDLLGCVSVGAGIGVFLQYLLGTSALLTAGFTVLGGIAGLYTTARYAMRLEKKK